MWIPTPIYERIPQFWLLLGLLFMTSGTYLGFEYSLSFVYFGVGFACCLWSLWIFSMRLRSHRETKATEQLERRVENAERAERAEHAEHAEHAEEQTDDELHEHVGHVA